MNKLLHTDFLYKGVSIDYIREGNCQKYGCDNICRCSKIKNTSITTDLKILSEAIYHIYFDLKNSDSSKRNKKLDLILNNISKEFNIYCINRILKNNKIWEDENWNIEIIDSYYGEEVDKVNLNINVSSKISNQIENNISLDKLTPRVNDLLKLEYGYITKELYNKKYKIENIKRNDIIIPNKEHFEKASSEIKYNENNIKCVVVLKGNKYKLVDGYHRLSKSKSDKVKAIIGY